MIRIVLERFDHPQEGPPEAIPLVRTNQYCNFPGGWPVRRSNRGHDYLRRSPIRSVLQCIAERTFPAVPQEGGFRVKDCFTIACRSARAMSQKLHQRSVAISRWEMLELLPELELLGLFNKSNRRQSGCAHDVIEGEKYLRYPRVRNTVRQCPWKIQQQHALELALSKGRYQILSFPSFL